MEVTAADSELELLEETELDRVERWRTEELERAGYGGLSAATIAGRLEIDLHVAVELRARGCPEELALQILL